MNSFSLKTKLIILMLAFLVFSLALGGVGIYSSQKVAEDYSEIETMNLPDTTAILEALAHFRSARIYLEKLGYPNLDESLIKEMKKRIPEEWDKFDQQIKNYIGEKPLLADEKILVQALQEKEEIIKKTFSKLLALEEKNSGKEGPSMEEFRKIVNEDLMKQGAEFRIAVNELVKYQKEDAKKNSTKAHETRDKAKKITVISLSSAVILGLIIFGLIYHNILKDQTEAQRLFAEASKNSNIIEKSPINIMMATPEGDLSFVNEHSKATLKTLEKYLPEKVDNILGKSIDMFHKNPSVIRNIIKDPRNLPHSAIINVGPDKLELLVSAIYDHDGKYLGPLVTWNIVTDKMNLITDLVKSSQELDTAAETVLAVSSTLSAAAEETSAQANTASVASEEVSAGVQHVSSNMGEMTSAIKEITKTTNEAATMTKEAMELAKNANKIVSQLGDSSLEIGNVIKVISSIAQQTNLLALNATIEAARAGEAGKGFAVVANEVKELAKQTAKATGEITQKIEAIQSDSLNAASAIASISEAIEKVNGYTNNIAAAVEEQAATTNEVTRIVLESTEGVHQINENISQVSIAAANTGKDANKVLIAAKSVEAIASTLETYINKLKSGGAMDFEGSIKGHREWKLKLSNYIKKPDGSLKVEIVCQDNKCPLGQWIYGSGLRWETHSEYGVLKTEHAKFHKSASEVIAIADTKQNLNEEELIGDKSAFGQASTNTINAIMAIKAKAT